MSPFWRFGRTLLWKKTTVGGTQTLLIGGPPEKKGLYPPPSGNRTQGPYIIPPKGGE